MMFTGHIPSIGFPPIEMRTAEANVVTHRDRTTTVHDVFGAGIGLFRHDAHTVKEPFPDAFGQGRKAPIEATLTQQVRDIPMRGQEHPTAFKASAKYIGSDQSGRYNLTPVLS
jgi:hypothetical protein